MQCGQIYCREMNGMDCTPPEGWIYWVHIHLPRGGYTLVTVNGICKGIEREHCCTRIITGASGWLHKFWIKNDLTKECAFETNASNGTGWRAGKGCQKCLLIKLVCPLDYKVDDTRRQLFQTPPWTIWFLLKCSFCQEWCWLSCYFWELCLRLDMVKGSQGISNLDFLPFCQLIEKLYIYLAPISHSSHLETAEAADIPRIARLTYRGQGTGSINSAVAS